MIVENLVFYITFYWAITYVMRLKQVWICFSVVQGYMFQCYIPANGLNLVIFDFVNIVMMMIFLTSTYTLLWYIRILLPNYCNYSSLTNTRLSRVLNKCKQDIHPFPPVIENLYFKSLDMRLLLNILTETRGIRASLTVLSLFDAQFRQLFKPQLEKVVSSASKKTLCVSWREPYGASLASLAMDQVQFILGPCSLWNHNLFNNFIYFSRTNLFFLL